VLSEKSRSEIFRGLGPIIGEEAVDEMLAHYLATEGEQPVTRSHLDANLAELRVELHQQTKQLLIWIPTAMAAISAAVFTITGTSTPRPSISAWRMRAGSFGEGTASNTALPLFSSVRTLVQPRPSSSTRHSAIGTRLLPPTLIPRSRQIYTVISDAFLMSMRYAIGQLCKIND